MCKVKNLAIENEGMRDKITFLEDVIDQQREKIHELEAEKTALEREVDIKSRMVEGLKLNNSSLTTERNILIKKIDEVKRGLDCEDVGKGRQFARELLGR